MSATSDATSSAGAAPAPRFVTLNRGDAQRVAGQIARLLAWSRTAQFTLDELGWAALNDEALAEKLRQHSVAYNDPEWALPEQLAANGLHELLDQCITVLGDAQ